MIFWEVAAVFVFGGLCCLRLRMLVWAIRERERMRQAEHVVHSLSPASEASGLEGSSVRM